MHLDARVCWGVGVSVCVSESVSVSVSVCVLVCVCPCELMSVQSCGQRTGRLEAGPRSRQIQPDAGKRGGWPGRCGRGAGRVRTEGSPRHKATLVGVGGKLEAESEAGRQEKGGSDESQAGWREGCQGQLEERVLGWARSRLRHPHSQSAAPPLQCGCSGRY